MNFIGIIPARYNSTRFQGKPLALIDKKPMIQRVYENISGALENIWVATDNEQIFTTVENFGGKAVMTSCMHQSGTDRCAEAARIIQHEHFDVIINIQGDEPFVKSSQIELLKSCFREGVEIATLIKHIETEEELFNINRPKVVIDNDNNALYFSRSPIPFVRGKEKSEWINENKYWAHIGMYAYKADVLQKITNLKPGKLEMAESLEQLRWLENGFKIKTAVSDYQSIGIDTPDDLEYAVKLIRNKTVL